MEEIYRLDARHRPRLWAAMMHARAAENTNISFEGMLSHTELAQMEGVGHEESDVLKRSTLQPKRDFRILPLTPQNVSAIVKAITSKIAFGNRGIIHVQIERNGKMAFAAYDNFDRECVVAYPAVSSASLDELTMTGVLRNYIRVVQPTS
jgi:hypothetical protein